MGAPSIHFSVDRDSLTGGLQLSINDGNGGYRLAGPKYSGRSETLLKRLLTKRDVEEIRRYLDRVEETQ